MRHTPIHLFTLTLCAAVLLAALPTDAQTVNIPDANLRAAITKALGKAPNAEITRAEMETLETLLATYANIRSLEGLQFATNMRVLYLSGNDISDLTPLAGLTEMRLLDLYFNDISDLSPLAGLTRMETLYLPNNDISDLSPLAGLTNIGFLHLSNNEVSDLSPLAGLDIGSLNLSNNDISDISALAGMNWMQLLVLSNNDIFDISPLAGITYLRELLLSNNDISDISPLAGITRTEDIRVLHLSNNGISDISALERMTYIREVHLDNNDISDISSLAGMTNIRELALSHNDISDISALEWMTNAWDLHLDNNDISDISPLVRMTRTKVLNLSNNHISDFSPIMWLVKQDIFALIADGNLTTPPEALQMIAGPWVWLMNFLDPASLTAIATTGVTAGETFRGDVWRSGTLSPSFGNINTLVEDFGLVKKKGIRHEMNGSIVLDSPRQQHTTMYVVSDSFRTRDSIPGIVGYPEVWFNGEQRFMQDYFQAFPVTLKQGKNVLLVTVYEAWDGWTAHFGFTPDAEYTVVSNTRTFLTWDVNRDGQVSVLDLTLVAQSIGTNVEADPAVDVNGDGVVTILDLVLVAQHLGESNTSAAPAPLTVEGSGLEPSAIQHWIDLAEQVDTDAPAFRAGIANLKQLLTLFVPEETALFANYPNPFNPETWIPYHLTHPAEVRIQIYTANGARVRTLDLGHHPAGLYEKRSRAAYWDGKNDVGESVSSGVYFYTLTAGDFIATRKMLILK